MNSRRVLIKFPNDYYWEEFNNFIPNHFVMDKQINNEIFGWYEDIYVSILVEDIKMDESQ